MGGSEQTRKKEAQKSRLGLVREVLGLVLLLTLKKLGFTVIGGTSVLSPRTF